MSSSSGPLLAIDTSTLVASVALYRAGVFTAAELDQIRLNGLTDQPLRP